MSYLQLAKKIQAETKGDQLPFPSADPIEGDIIAVEICSTFLESHIWLAFDRTFNPNDGQAVFYAEELEFLKTKPPEQLKRIHENKVKLGPGYKVTK